jgi:hypothetical protein
VRTFTGRFFLAIVVVVVGLTLRSWALVETAMADAQLALAAAEPAAAVERFDAIDVDAAFATRLPVAGAAVRGVVADGRARAAYWLGDYTALPPTGEEGAASGAALDLVLLSANAGYRTVQRGDAEVADAVRGLDAVLQSYAGVLRRAPGDRDAAYNYEFVALQRLLLAGGGEMIPPADQATADPSEMQGGEGAPPPDTAPADFNVIVPMSPDERGEFEAGAGSVQRRVG